MAIDIPFDNSYAQLPEGFFARLNPAPVQSPKLLAYNKDLAQTLGISQADDQELAEIFAGNQIPQGADPLAQLYAGHQFGQYTAQLGDGRALLLGEVIGRDGLRRDIQLKGSGPTPFSRSGDGRAWLGPVLREYVISEAMHALGIPTTRALAAVSTGEDIQRSGPKPGAILTRVAQSHLRVGSFQVFAYNDQVSALKTLTDYAIKRHYPQAKGPMDLLRAVCKAQAQLIPAWLAVGFIHGVMNTDNCTISGETIDYGPCAFMDAYDRAQVFSSIDHSGRYAFENQANISVWNMAQLATALLHQMDDKETVLDEATQIIHDMPAQLQQGWRQRFGEKIGLKNASPADQPLIDDFLALMQNQKADFTNTFAALTQGNAREQFIQSPESYDAWALAWEARLQQEENPKAVMAQANPVIIPRNHRLEEMIKAATEGDFSLFHRLNQALSRPFETTDVELHAAPQENERIRATFCGT